MLNTNAKSNVMNNIVVQMSMYLDAVKLDILQRIIEEQFVFVNMEEITTLPATVDNSAQEQNEYLIKLLKIKKKNLSEKTIEQYERAVRNLIAQIDKPLIKMDELDIDYYLRYYEHNSGKRKQATTCNNERQFLQAFFTWLRKEKFIANNPVEAIERKKEPGKPIDYFRPDQIERLREGCVSLRDRAIIEILRSTGARVGEVVAINRKDIDWNTGDILICGEKGGRYRTIYLDEVARYHVEKYLDSRKDNNEALIVGLRAPYKRLTTDGVRAALKVIAERQHITYRVYPHKMRKTLGMQLKNQGHDIGTVQEVLGHASPAVTSRYYAESTPDTLRSIRKKVA